MTFLYSVIRKTLILTEILLIKYGLFKSFWTQKSEIDGKPVPWFTIPSIEYINSLELSDYEVFEWGCGNSTLFWANHAKTVISIEDNSEWYARIKKIAPQNSHILLEKSNAQYINALSQQKKKFDIISIDGIKLRFQCAQQAIKFLKKTGFIILDNSDWHPKTIKFLRDEGFLQIDFCGFYHGNGYTGITSIFLQPTTIIQFRNKIQKPIGGLDQLSE